MMVKQSVRALGWEPLEYLSFVGQVLNVRRIAVRILQLVPMMILDSLCTCLICFGVVFCTLQALCDPDVCVSL